MNVNICVLIALQWYYSIYQVMYIKGLLNKESVKSTIQFLANVRRIWLYDHWVISEATAKEQRLLDTLEISIP